MQSVALLEFYSVIQFLQVKRNNAVENHLKMNKNLNTCNKLGKERRRELKEGPTDVHEDGGQSGGSVRTHNIVHRMNLIV